jgi:hypothetical protein
MLRVRIRSLYTATDTYTVPIRFPMHARGQKGPPTSRVRIRSLYNATYTYTIPIHFRMHAPGPLRTIELSLVAFRACDLAITILRIHTYAVRIRFQVRIRSGPFANESAAGEQKRGSGSPRLPRESFWQRLRASDHAVAILRIYTRIYICTT